MLKRLCRGASDPALLELACGGGRTARPLVVGKDKVEDLWLVGIDVGPRPLEVARRRCRNQAQFVRADMMQLPFRKGVFDGAFCVFGGFLSFPLAEAAKLLRMVRQILRPGGFLLIEFPSEHFLSGLDGFQEWWVGSRSYAGDFPHVGLSENFYYRKQRAYVRRDYVIDLRDGSCTELSQSHRVYSDVELSGLLERSGFNVRFCLGTWDEEPFDEQSPNLIVVADSEG